jgi:site-specific recombinase XerD
MERLDAQARSARVLGKGNKERTVHFGKKAARSL